MGGGGGGLWGAVKKSDFTENPKSDLDMDLGFVNYCIRTGFRAFVLLQAR